MKFGLCLLFTSSHSEIHADKLKVCCYAFIFLDFDCIINNCFVTSFFCLQPSSFESQAHNWSSDADHIAVLVGCFGNLL